MQGDLLYPSLGVTGGWEEVAAHVHTVSVAAACSGV